MSSFRDPAESPRDRSASDVEGTDSLVVNRNVDWASSKRAWAAYILSFFVLRYIGVLFPVPQLYGWTFIHVFHGIASFYIVHWAKGSPNIEDNNAYRRKTWWEQLDDGQQFTPTRKFFTLIPIMTFFAASHESSWEHIQLTLNTFVLAIVLIAKLPAMHKVRLFKINAD